MTDLKLDIWDVFTKRHPCGPVNDLHAYRGLTFGFENIIHQILWSKVYVATPVRIVLAQHTLRV